LFGRTGEVINADEETYNQWQMWHLFGRTGEVINVDEEAYNQWQM
jgi:ribosomal protein L21E